MFNFRARLTLVLRSALGGVAKMFPLLFFITLDLENKRSHTVISEMQNVEFFIYNFFCSQHIKTLHRILICPQYKASFLFLTLGFRCFVKGGGELQ